MVQLQVPNLLRLFCSTSLLPFREAKIQKENVSSRVIAHDKTLLQGGRQSRKQMESCSRFLRDHPTSIQLRTTLT